MAVVEVTAVAMEADTAADAVLAARISAVAADITSADIAAASRAIRSDERTLDARISAVAALPRGTRTLEPCAAPRLRRAMHVMP